MALQNILCQWVDFWGMLCRAIWYQAAFEALRRSGVTISLQTFPTPQNWTKKKQQRGKKNSRKRLQKFIFWFNFLLKMANILLQTTAYGLNIIGGIIMVLAVLLPYWKENDVEVCVNFLDNFKFSIISSKIDHSVIQIILGKCSWNPEKNGGTISTLYF